MFAFHRFKHRWNIHLTNSYKKHASKEDQEEEPQDIFAASNIKEENATLEPTFVNMDLLYEQSFRANESTTTVGRSKHPNILYCVNELIEWSKQHDVESLYLKMLQGLRNRIRLRNITEQLNS